MWNGNERRGLGRLSDAEYLALTQNLSPEPNDSIKLVEIGICRDCRAAYPYSADPACQVLVCRSLATPLHQVEQDFGCIHWERKS